MAEEAPGGNAGDVPDSGAEDVGASVIVEPGSDASNAGTRTLPAAAMKFADLTESGSESGDNEGGESGAAGPENGNTNGEPGTSASATAEDATGRSSPPPNCAICLSRCRRKCFTDSCMHQFCFKCLCEWSKIKPECPLCKQPFKTIIHNVRTLDDYDRYPVQSTSPVLQDHPSLRFHIVRRPRFMPLVQNQAVMTNDIEAGIAAGGAGEEVLPAAEVAAGRHSYSRFEPYRMELMNFYRHDQDAATSGSLSQLWRRYVYDRKLYALPVSDTLTGHFREWSARFYRNNPAQMHRLMPWIHRDIVCLLRNAAHSVSTVVQLMHDILPMTNILGPTFRRRLSPFLGERTSHFIHELFNFARSPFDMIGYDHVVQYSSRVAEEVEVDLLDMVETQSSNGSDLHLEVADGEGEAGNAESSNGWNAVSALRPSTSVIVTNPGATHSFSVTMASDGSELPGISIRRTTTSNVGSQTVAINLSMRRPAAVASEDAEVIEIDDGDAAANAEVAAINDGSNPSRRHAGATLPVSAHIELQSSSSSGDEDECVFVLELKPPHLRTPEQVSLDSNSDSDVVFVNEQNEAPPAASVGDQAIQSPVDQSSRDQGLFMGPSTSAAANRGKNWKLVVAEARRLDQLRTLRSTRSKRSRQRSSVPARSGSGSSNSSCSSSSFHFNSSSDEDSSASSSSNAEPAKRKKRKKASSRKRSGKGSKGKRSSRKRRRRAEEINNDLSQVEVAVLELQRQLEREVAEQQPQEQPESSSDSPSSSDDESAADSSETSGPPNTNNNNSSSDGSDDDSTENLQLSALRATLKAEATLEDRKPLKLELRMPDGDDGEQQQEVPHNAETLPAPTDDTEPQCSAPKRRRSCSNSNLSSQSASLASSSTATSSSVPMSSFSWRASGYAGDPLMRGPVALEEHDIANSLIELSTLTQPREIGLFNEHSDGVEISLSFLRNTLRGSPHALEEDDAHLGIYSDADADPEPSNERSPLEAAIDVVGEAEVETAEDTATATEEQDEEDEDIDDDDEGEDEQEEKAEDDEEEEDDSDNNDEEEEDQEPENNDPDDAAWALML